MEKMDWQEVYKYPERYIVAFQNEYHLSGELSSLREQVRQIATAKMNNIQ